MGNETDGRILRSLRTKEKILDAAFHIFIKNGFEKTTITQIIKEAKIGYGSAYTHFKGKDDILIALMDDVMEDFYQIAEYPFEPRSVSEAKSKINHQVVSFLKLAESERDILRVFYEAKGMSAEVENKWKNIRERFIERISQDIAYSQKNGLAKQMLNKHLVAKSWFFSNEMYLWDLVIHEGYNYTIKEIADTITEIYTNGLYK